MKWRLSFITQSRCSNHMFSKAGAMTLQCTRELLTGLRRLCEDLIGVLMNPDHSTA